MYLASIVSSDQSLNDDKVNNIKKILPQTISISTIKNKSSVDFCFTEKPIIPKSINQQYQIDIIIQQAELRNKRLLICDMESTIIENEFLDEIADLLGIKNQVARITESAMNGEIDFNGALKERVSLIKGLSKEKVSELLHSRLRYNAGAKQLIAACRKAGIYTMLVSGGFTIFTDHVAKELGFDEAHANQLIFEQGKLTGVKEPILGKEAKLKFLQEKAKELGITLAETAAIGDGANDLPMLKNAGLGLAYKAKAKVQEEIENQINFTDLKTAAYAFGIEI